MPSVSGYFKMPNFSAIPCRNHIRNCSRKGLLIIRDLTLSSFGRTRLLEAIARLVADAPIGKH